MFLQDLLNAGFEFGECASVRILRGASYYVYIKGRCGPRYYGWNGISGVPQFAHVIGVGLRTAIEMQTSVGLKYHALCNVILLSHLHSFLRPAAW